MTFGHITLKALVSCDIFGHASDATSARVMTQMASSMAPWHSLGQDQ